MPKPKGPPPVPHPWDLIQRDAFAREAGIDPEDFSAWLEWRKPIPPAIRDKLVATGWPRLPPGSFWVEEETLPSFADGATITTPMQLESTQKRVRGALPTKHPFADALRKKGLSLAEWAKKHGVSASYARSWIQTGAGARPIPEKFVKVIERELGVPESAWKNGTTK